MGSIFREAQAFGRKKPSSLGYFANRESTVDRQQLREAELVPVRIGYVKVALAPCRISRGLNCQTLCLQRPVVYVHLIDSKNSSTPPPVFVPPARHQVQISMSQHQSARQTALDGSYPTPIQVSVRTGIAKATLARWRRDGRGPVFLKRGARIEYPSRELEVWLQARRAL